MKEKADDGGGQFGGVRIDAGLMPFVGPVHHAEEAKDRDAGVDAGREAFRGKGVEDFTCQGVIAALDGLDFFAVRVAKGVFLVGENFHLVGMGEEILDRSEEEEVKTFGWFVDAVETGSEVFEYEGKGCALN